MGSKLCETSVLRAFQADIWMPLIRSEGISIVTSVFDPTIKTVLISYVHCHPHPWNPELHGDQFHCSSKPAKNNYLAYLLRLRYLWRWKRSAGWRFAGMQRIIGPTRQARGTNVVGLALAIAIPVSARTRFPRLCCSYLAFSIMCMLSLHIRLLDR